MNQSCRTPVFYLSKPHSCAYHKERVATSVFLDPAQTVGNGVYDRLLESGFRRSGELIYRPQCRSCSACVSLRVDCDSFRSSRSHRRNLAKNRDLDIVLTRPRFEAEHFRLYCRYQRIRHSGGSMDSGDVDQYRRFIVDSGVNTEFMECHLAGRLVAIAVMDITSRGLSAMYTFYDPGFEHRGIGTYCILRQIATARERRLRWLYLGYWVEECRKMAYKARFEPAQGFVNQKWTAFPG